MTRVCFILVRRTPSRLGPVLSRVYDGLRERDVVVEDVIPEETLLGVTEMGARHDLYLLKSHTELALSVAGTLAALGGRLLNSHHSCLVAQDKLTSIRLLSGAGVPVPDSWATEDYALLHPLLDQGPLIAKPHRGHLGQGIRVLRDVEDLRSLTPAKNPYVFQRYLQTEEEDIKAYVVEGRAFAVAKRFTPGSSYRLAGRPVELNEVEREVVLRCGRALGLSLYGVDLVRTDGGPYVVDVNYFPGYKGVPGAAELIADHIYRYAVARRRAMPGLEGVA